MAPRIASNASVVPFTSNWAELPWLGAKGRCEAYLKMARSSAEIGDHEAERRFHAEARKNAWAKATGTIALRRLLGHERAGALARTLRSLAGR